MIGLHSQLASLFGLVFHRVLPFLVSLVILLPVLAVWAHDRGAEHDEDEAEFT